MYFFFDRWIFLVENGGIKIQQNNKHHKRSNMIGILGPSPGSPGSSLAMVWLMASSTQRNMWTTRQWCYVTSITCWLPTRSYYTGLSEISSPPWEWKGCPMPSTPGDSHCPIPASSTAIEKWGWPASKSIGHRIVVFVGSTIVSRAEHDDDRGRGVWLRGES